MLHGTHILINTRSNNRNNNNGNNTNNENNNNTQQIPTKNKINCDDTQQQRATTDNFETGQQQQ